VDNWQKALADIRNYRVKSGLEIPKVLLKYSSNSDSDDIRRLNEAMAKPLAFWSQFESGIPDVNVFLYSEKDLDWFLSMWTQYKMGEGAIDFWKRSGDFGGGAVLVDTLGNPSVWFKNLTTSDFHSEPTDYYFHEVTHFYQKKMFGSQEAPCWFLEGSAMLVGYANGFESSIQNNSYARFNRNLKITSLNAYIGSLPGDKGEKLLDLVSRSHNDIICNTREPLLGYGLGWLISEKIVADYSWSRFIEFMRRSGQQTWKLAFKENFGVEHKEFYANTLVPYLLRVLA
jgi:hypothetical protein